MHNPKSPLVVVHREYKGDDIIWYLIQDIRNGQLHQYDPDTLKQKMRTDDIQLANLKLTNDNRLILVNNAGQEKETEFIDETIQDENKEARLERKFVLLLRMMSMKYKRIKVKGLDKKNNTFVLEFTRDRKDEGLQIAMKYDLYFSQSGKPWAQMMPIALRFRQYTYPLTELEFNECVRIDMSENLDTSVFTQVIENFGKLFYQICKTDDSLAGLDDTSFADYLDKMDRNPCYGSSFTSEDEAHDFGDAAGAVITSGLVYGSLFGMLVTCHEPALALGITATSGSLLNLMVQHFRMLIFDC